MSKKTNKTIASKPRREAVESQSPFEMQAPLQSSITTADIAAFAYGYSAVELAFLNRLFWLDSSDILFTWMLDEIMTGLEADFAATKRLLAQPNVTNVDDLIKRLPQYETLEVRYVWNAAHENEEPEGKEMGIECKTQNCRSTKYQVRITQDRSADEGSTMSLKCVKCKAFTKING